MSMAIAYPIGAILIAKVAMRAISGVSNSDVRFPCTRAYFHTPT